MNKYVFVLAGLVAMMTSCNAPKESENLETIPAAGEKVVLVIHGGAGTIVKEKMTPEREEEYRAALTAAIKSGYEALQAGKSSLDAVEASIHVMEDSPLFNAGKGAVFTHDGKNELDASIMDGKTLAAGSVAGVTTVKSPISAARAVMEKSEHVMMVGRGAELFAAQVGLEIVDPKYFWTESRWNGLQRILERDKNEVQLDHDQKTTQLNPSKPIDEKFGTVGCVALDQEGNLAAGTSTGGMTNKKYGRVGDAPIIGAGNYANNATVAISCTGWGEFYIRTVAAHSVSSKMQYANLSVADASQQVMDEIGQLGGDGGMIALDKNGNMAMPFNTAGMYRGYVKENGEITIEIYK